MNEYHHKLTIASYKRASENWERRVDKKLRCKFCWLRPSDCFCSYFLQKRKDYEAKSLKLETLGIILYYHFQEVGRSANTAHLLPLLLPSSIRKNVIFGNEQNWISDLKCTSESSNASSFSSLCVFYPCKEAISFSSWVASRHSETSFNLVVLDGTYSQAQR